MTVLLRLGAPRAPRRGRDRDRLQVGRKQTLTGPALIVPWTERWTTTDDKGVRYAHVTLHRLVLLPESLRVRPG